MNIEIEERNWRKRSTEPMKTGWDFADHAEQIADFLADLDLVDYDSFVSVHFSDYICRGSTHNRRVTGHCPGNAAARSQARARKEVR